MIIVAIGNPFDGITVHGPFTTVDGAAEWAESNTDEDWNILTVWSVEDSDQWDEGYEDNGTEVIDRFEDGYEF